MRIEKNAAANRSRQIAQIDAFISQYFSSEFEVEHGDRPDAVIRIGSTTIGIEHSEFHQSVEGNEGVQPRAQIECQRAIVRAARKRFSDESNRKLWLIARFDNETGYRKNQCETIGAVFAQALIDALRSIPTSTQSTEWLKLELWNHTRLGLPFPSQVSEICFRIVDDKPRFECWGPAHAYMVPHLSASEVQERLDTKESNILAYRLKCDEVWFLGTVDSGLPSDHFDLEDKLRSIEYYSSFSKVILFKVSDRLVVELKNCPFGGPRNETVE
jgi:hypothetical protein